MAFRTPTIASLALCIAVLTLIPFCGGKEDPSIPAGALPPRGFLPWSEAVAEWLWGVRSDPAPFLQRRALLAAKDSPVESEYCVGRKPAPGTSGAGCCPNYEPLLGRWAAHPDFKRWVPGGPGYDEGALERECSSTLLIYWWLLRPRFCSRCAL